jgi:probable rRNA maturation factor
VAHSALHLIGYDHMTPEEEEVMTAKQEAVLTELHITREN